jgi:hypothetical protein
MHRAAKETRLVPIASASFGGLALATVLCGLCVGASAGGCGSRNDLDPSDAAVIDDRARLPDTEHPDAACSVAIDTPELLPATHVPVGTDVQWNSNPPSSGPHYPVWAAFQAYTSPVPRGYYVHDLEHGAIVLLYRCDPGVDCAAVAAQLQQVSDAIPTDPLCTAAGQGVRVRTVITPDPLLDVPVAAAAWGWTYKAACVDLPSLIDFANAHYGQGPEVLCGNGQPTF